MPKPLFLLADSTPMFLTAADEDSLLERVYAFLPDNPKVAYLGASNGDDPNYFEIFCAAMDKVNIQMRRHISAPYTAEDLAWLRKSDLILLSGGDVMLGWQTFEQSDLQQLLQNRYQQGCVLMGISAGAIQLSAFLFGEDGDTTTHLLPGMGLAKCLVDVHDQDRDWCRLKHLSQLVPAGTPCVGIPSNGVLMVTPEGELVASGAPLYVCEAAVL